MNIVMSVKPDAPDQENWALHVYPNDTGWKDPDKVTLQGFRSAFEAFAFAFAHFSIDVSKRDFNRRWTLKPSKPKIKQLVLRF